MRLEVSGASDDLIEVEGDIQEEFGGGEKERFLHFGDGTVLAICYGPKDDPSYFWRIRIVNRGTASIEMKPGRYHEEEPGMKCDKAVLTGDLGWVRCYSKASGPSRQDMLDSLQSLDWDDLQTDQLQQVYDVVIQWEQ